MPTRLLFLPGASGNTRFWYPVADMLWGDADPISPVAVGRRLASLLRRAELHVIEGGDHDLANTCSHAVAPLIDEYLARSP